MSNSDARHALFTSTYAFIERWVRSLTPLDLLIGVQVAFVAGGIARLDFNISPVDASIAVAVAVLSEWLFTRSWGYVPKSAIAAGLGIAIFFRASNPLYFALCAFLAIASKYALRFEGKHIFNPSNFGIVCLALAVPFGTTIEFTQWGSSPYLYGAISAATLFISHRAGMFPITASFIASYTLLLLALAPSEPSLFAVHHYGLLGPSFILFASFMITDPKTAPRGWAAGTVQGVCVALLFFLLEALEVRYSLFIASFVLAILNVSARAIASYGLVRIRTGKVPFNMLSLGIILCAFVFAMLSVSPDLGLRRTMELSPHFVLFGIEGERLRQCAASPAFIRRSGSELARKAVTSGAAWGDYDADGNDDIFISSLDVPSTLYRNAGDGTFTDITESVGLPRFHSRSAFFIDHDNDGDSDLFVVFPSEGGPGSTEVREQLVRVYENTGGVFADATARLGLEEFRALPSSGTMSFGDYDNDGDLDFVVATSGRFLHLVPKKFRAFQKSVADPAFPPHSVRRCGKEELQDIVPQLLEMTGLPEELATVENFLSQENVCVDLHYDLSLIERLGISGERDIVDATVYVPGKARLFEDVGGSYAEKTAFREQMDALVSRGLHAKGPEDLHPYDYISGVYWQPVSFDYDDDGRMDLFLAVEFGTNVLLRNEGGLSFSNVTETARMNYKSSGMGVDVGDYNGDGLPDVVVTNVNRDYLYRNEGDGVFSNLFDSVTLGAIGIGWGVAFFDYNLDGREDIYITNGDTLETLSSVSPWLNRRLFRGDKLYQNTGTGFTDNSRELCPDVLSGKALAVSDYDNDGDEDVFVGNYDHVAFESAEEKEGNLLYENVSADSGSNQYLGIVLRGTRSNAMGIGAKVAVSAEGRTQTQWVLAGSSLNSQHGRKLLFGFGTSSVPVDVSVRWPSGRETHAENVSLRQTIHIIER